MEMARTIRKFNRIVRDFVKQLKEIGSIGIKCNVQ